MRSLAAATLLLVAAVACTGPGFHGPDILYVATPELVGVEMLRIAGVTAEDVVYDLGSGDGRVVIAAARDFGAHGVGVEIEAPLVQESRDAALRAGVAGRTLFLWQDLFATDISPATVVTLYLRDDVNLRLRPKLLRELRPGTRVVSHDFGMADWSADRVVRVRGPDREHTIYFWRVPADAAGTWTITLGGRRTAPLVLDLEQTFQRVAGTLAAGDRRWPAAGTLDGTALSVGAGPWRFTGRLSGDGAAGDAVDDTGAPGAWTAHRRPR